MGTVAIGNGTVVFIENFASDNTIGGTTAGVSNLVSGNNVGISIAGSGVLKA